MDFAKLKLNDDRVLVKVIPERHLKLESGIILPKSVTSGVRLATCKVVAIGTGQITLSGNRVPPAFAEGEYIQVAHGVGVEVTLEPNKPDVQYMILREADIVWKVSDYVEEEGEDINLIPSNKALKEVGKA